MGNEDFAADMKKYLRDLFPFYGVKSPERKSILQGIFQRKKNRLKISKTRKA